MAVINVVKVFLGSPGGLEPERSVARQIVDEINHSHSEHWGCQIKLVGWEATLPGHNRAQSLINQDLDKCDYFIGVIWNHWGSKPNDIDSKYTSGFEEEFELSKAKLKKGTMKDVALFFKEIPDVQLNDLGPSVCKVIKFREKCIDEHELFFKNFKDTNDFEKFFRAKIEEIGWKESIEWKESFEESSDPSQPINTDTRKTSSPDASDGLIGKHSVHFLSDLLQRPADWDATDPYEIAMLRLIAFSAYRSGNDEMYLGNHDANLLFAKRNNFEFSNREVSALIDAAVVGFDHQNVPLWHWLSVLDNSTGNFDHLKFLANFGNSHEQPNAIRILQSMGRSTPAIDDLIDRKTVIRRWLLSDAGPQSMNAALSFLKTNGDANDLAIIEELFEDASENHKSRLAETMVAILANKNISDAFKKLINLDPEPIEENTLDRLFAYPESISTQTLELCLGLKADNIRRNAVRLLHKRQAIDLPAAERMMTDSDIEVRLIALENLMLQGEAPEEATIKKALIKPKAGGLLGLASSLNNHSDTSCYEIFQRSELSLLGYDQLRRKAEEQGVFDHLTITSLYKKFTKKCLPEMRRNLADGFKFHFDDGLKRLAAKVGEDTKVVNDVRNLESFVRNRLIAETLEILCKYGDRSDLDIVRKASDDLGENYFLVPVLHFFGRFGDWSDKERISAFENRYSRTNTISSSFIVGNRANQIAASLYNIGHSRLIDMLKIDVGVAIRRCLIAKMSQKDILSLSDDIIMSELNNKDDVSRKIVALKCAQAMSKTRIRQILANYVSQDIQHHYNSVHWLDLGASMSRKLVKIVATFELAMIN